MFVRAVINRRCTFSLQRPEESRRHRRVVVQKFQEHLCISSSFRSGALSIQVHLLEKGLPELVGADHDGAGWCHFDHPGHETWGKTHNVLTTWTTKQPEFHSAWACTCKKTSVTKLGPDFLHDLPRGRGSLQGNCEERWDAVQNTVVNMPSWSFNFLPVTQLSVTN